jgi:alcohol dehydrogenase (NADP+)
MEVIFFRGELLIVGSFPKHSLPILSLMLLTKGYAAQSATSPIAPFSFERRHPGAHDVHLEISHCGVCHTDIHMSRNEWGGSLYPMVPGHEIIGTVKQVGSSVTKFAPGDRVGVGCFVDSCRTCSNCNKGLENYCENHFTGTYNSLARDGVTPNYGGYSNQIVVDERFVLKVSEKLDPAGVAPLLCAGITTYSPLRHWNVGPGQKVGVIGLGGLGHMAIKFAHSFGAHVVCFTTSAGKVADAKRLGADEVILSTSSEEMAKSPKNFDFILDTVSAAHDLGAYVNLLKRDGTLCMVGIPPEGEAAPVDSLIMGRRRLAGSLVGGLPETQEMLDYCAAHGITSDVEVIPIEKINEAYDRILKSDVKYRFVIDMATL